jgi:hypothetical protein
MLIRPSPPVRRTDANRRECMPGCHSCRVAVIGAVQSASSVRDVGFAGVVSIAAASALGMGYKRGLFDTPGAFTAASDADAGQAQAATIEIPTASRDRLAGGR